MTMKETTRKYWELVREYCSVMQKNKLQVYMVENSQEPFCIAVEERCNKYRSNYMKPDVKSLDRHKLAAIMVEEGLNLNIIDADAIDQILEADNINIASEKILMLAALDFLKAEINKAIIKEQDSDSETKLTTFDNFSYPKPWACETDFVSIISRTLYYAKKDYSLNAMELAEKFFLIEYISILIQHPADADQYFAVLKKKEHLGE